METNNPLVQKKNTRMQPCQQLESHSSLSCSSIHPFVQQSVTIYQEPATGLGTSIKPSPSCWEAHSVAWGDRCTNSFWYKGEGGLGRFPLLPGRIGKGSQGTAFLPIPPPTLPAVTWGVKVQAGWVGEQPGILISYRGSALNLTSLHWGSPQQGVRGAACSMFHSVWGRAGRDPRETMCFVNNKWLRWMMCCHIREAIPNGKPVFSSWLTAAKDSRDVFLPRFISTILASLTYRKSAYNIYIFLFLKNPFLSSPSNINI